MSATTEKRGLFRCDFRKELHRVAFRRILEAYMSHPMGDAPPLDASGYRRVMDALAAHDNGFVLLGTDGQVPVGMATCFVNYSTFTARPFINVHDLAVLPGHRRQGFARMILQGVTLEALQRGCAKVTLEVREDNAAAMGLYRSLGFAHTTPKMYYWSKALPLPSGM